MESKARRRWFLVKDTLKKKCNTLNQSTLSGRSFAGYSLIFREIACDIVENNDEFCWRRFSVGEDGTAIDVRVYSQRFSIEDITGIWPSEDVLAHFLLVNHRHNITYYKRLCEIGGGMTCLAGLAAALKFEFEEVLLTDGNEKSVANIQAIIDRNTTKLKSLNVRANRLRWDQLAADDPDGKMSSYFDLIVIADCLFFKESHSTLASSILEMLMPHGLCIIIAPQRDGTLNEFVRTAQSIFGNDASIVVTERYDEVLWQKAVEMMTNKSNGSFEFCKDQHYPLLIEIRKNNTSNK